MARAPSSLAASRNHASRRRETCAGSAALVVRIVGVVPVAILPAALMAARFDRGLAVGRNLVEMALQALPALALRLIAGTEFRDVIAAHAFQAVMAPLALFLAMNAVAAAQDLSGMRFAAQHRNAKTEDN